MRYHHIQTKIKIAFTWLLAHLFLLLYRKKFKSDRTFTFQGNVYPYFIHKYNTTWINERAVEVSIIGKIVNGFQGKILEVGNVLSHYFSITHDVLDKYEKAEGVVNEDVVHFNPPKKFDLIVSISTLEHVGWDETPRKPMKVLWAIENLKRLLAPNGEIIVTLPLGYNPEIDNLLNEGKIQFAKKSYLKRISIDNRWVETDWENVKRAKYNHFLNSAYGLIIGVMAKQENELRQSS